LLVNDQPVTVAAVKALAPLLLEVHGQSEHVELLEPSAQMDLLDQFAESKTCWTRLPISTPPPGLQHDLEQLSENEQDRLRRVDMLSFQVKELDQPGSPG